jgi:uncharacterized protein (TIGR02265 family)
VFDEPRWHAPLDVEAALHAIPSSATISGVFISSVVELVKKRGHTLARAGESYTAFKPYRLREQAELLIDAARAVWPDEPLRQGLRHLGRGAPQAVVQSMIGRVVLGSAEGPLEIISAMAKSYALHTKPASLEVVSIAPGRAVVRARDVFTFLDSHHVGVFEGVLRYAEVAEPRVRIHSWSDSEADLLCEWRGR